MMEAASLPPRNFRHSPISPSLAPPRATDFYDMTVTAIAIGNSGVSPLLQMPSMTGEKDKTTSTAAEDKIAF